MSLISERILRLLTKIPSGKVVTYGQLADIVHTSPRVVGNVLHKNKNPKKYPCHRVVKSDGQLAKGYVFGGEEFQRKLLQNEGIKFENGKVNLIIYRFTD